MERFPVESRHSANWTCRLTPIIRDVGYPWAEPIHITIWDGKVASRPERAISQSAIANSEARVTASASSRLLFLICRTWNP